MPGALHSDQVNRLFVVEQNGSQSFTKLLIVKSLIPVPSILE
jgi:hypothetical protein